MVTAVGLKKLTGLWCLASWSSWGCVSRRNSWLASGRTCPAAASHFLENVDFRAFSRHFVYFHERKNAALTAKCGNNFSVLPWRAVALAGAASRLVQSLAFSATIGCWMDHVTRSTRHAAATVGITAGPGAPFAQPAVHHWNKKESLSTWENFKLQKYIFFSKKNLENN